MTFAWFCLNVILHLYILLYFHKKQKTVEKER